MNWHVYVLHDPRGGHVRYVGQTKSPATRYRQHCACNFKAKASRAVYFWVKRLAADGLVPTMRVVETFDDKRAALNAEQEWIRQLRMFGANLLNREP